MIEEHVNQEDEELILRFRDPDEKKRFKAALYNAVNDRRWCYQHRIDYVYPDIKEAAKCLYNELSPEYSRQQE